ncbi:MAG: CoA-binding protein [Proteobacteria bacterium]|nr:CoA-binding protein [Pseudomonadota bacterium]
MTTNPSDEVIANILRNTRTIAIVGASTDPSRPSNDVMRFLMTKGFEVFPVNPQVAGRVIHGREVLAIDMVDCFRRSEFLAPIVDEAIAIGAKTIWMQLGVINELAAEKARQQGLSVVMDRCPVIEWRRLGCTDLCKKMCKWGTNA